MLQETDYYPFVETFIEERFSCVVTDTNKGYLALGLVDVVGAYDTGSEHHSELELIISEVKTTTSSFGKSIGQTLGYSIFAERCYLAIPFVNEDEFSRAQVSMASHLGIGLIKIETDSAGKPVQGDIVLSSKRHSPIPSQKTHLLRSLGIAQCYCCGSYYSLAEMHQIKRTTLSASLFSENKTRELCLCQECYKEIVPEAERSRRVAQSVVARKAVESRKKNRTDE